MDSSHDTIIMLFQNNESKEEKISQLSNKANDQIKKQPITQKLKCQMTETFPKTKRGQISSDFDYTSPVMLEDVINSSRTDFICWYTAHYRLTMDDSNFNLPSYIATKSLVSSAEIISTLCAFTPIIPHLVTQFDTIFTCMKNFQDVLLHKNISYGPL